MIVFGPPHVLRRDRVPAPRPEAAAHAEYVVAPETDLAHEPRDLPLAGLTAWRILVDTADVGRSAAVLVHTVLPLEAHVIGEAGRTLGRIVPVP